MDTMTDRKKAAPIKGKVGGSKAGGDKIAGKKAGDKEAGAEDGTGKRGGKKILIIALVALVVAAAGGFGSYVLFFQKPGPPPPVEGGAMVQMEPMTLSLTGRHYLKVQVAIQLVKGEASPETFETIKASQLLIDTFSNRDPDDLTSNAARKALTGQLLTGLHTTYPKEVYQVYLTQFVIQ